MLRHLRKAGGFPVPDVLYGADNLLILEHIEGEHLRPEAEHHCGELLAGVHDMSGSEFGFSTDTIKGSVVLVSP